RDTAPCKPRRKKTGAGRAVRPPPALECDPATLSGHRTVVVVVVSSGVVVVVVPGVAPQGSGSQETSPLPIPPSAGPPTSVVRSQSAPVSPPSPPSPLSSVSGPSYATQPETS